MAALKKFSASVGKMSVLAICLNKSKVLEANRLERRSALFAILKNYTTDTSVSGIEWANSIVVHIDIIILKKKCFKTLHSLKTSTNTHLVQ